MLCLANIMNLKQLAITPEILKDQIESIFSNVFIIYFAYSSQVEMDEALLGYLSAISHYQEYSPLLKDKTNLILHLAEK